MALDMYAVKELRARTGAGVLDCKKALAECEGNIEKSNGLRTYIDMRRMMMATVMLKDNRISKSRVGNGIIMTMSIPITPKAIIALLLLVSSVSQPPLTSDRAI